MEELDRVKVGLKAALIMRQESTAVRAASISSDWYYLKRVRPISELQTAIDSLSIDSLLGYLERHPPIHFTVVTLGPQPLTIPV
jgi:predicted Zn-dependent peptidase